MTAYVILLRPLISRRGREISRASLHAETLHDLARSVGLQLLDVLTCSGICDAILLCQAPETTAVSRLLDALQGWQTEVLLATSHTRFSL